MILDAAYRARNKIKRCTMMEQIVERTKQDRRRTQNSCKQKQQKTMNYIERDIEWEKRVKKLKSAGVISLIIERGIY